MDIYWKFVGNMNNILRIKFFWKTYLLLRNLEKSRWTGRKVPNRRTLVLHTVKGRS